MCRLLEHRQVVAPPPHPLRRELDMQYFSAGFVPGVSVRQAGRKNGQGRRPASPTLAFARLREAALQEHRQEGVRMFVRRNHKTRGIARLSQQQSAEFMTK